MKKQKIQIIEHESFMEIFGIENDFFHKMFGKNKFGDDLLKVSTLMNRIDRICTNRIADFSNIYPDDHNLPGSGLLRFKGQVFEIFINAALVIIGSHTKLGVYNFKPIPNEEDYGVDGIGYGIDNKPLTIQIKYRQDYNTELNQDDLKQFTWQSVRKYGVDPFTNNNLLLITSCKGLHFASAEKVFLGAIREVNLNDLKNIIDDNYVFWNNLLDLVDNTIIYNLGPKIFNNIKDSPIELLEY